MLKKTSIFIALLLANLLLLGHDLVPHHHDNHSNTASPLNHASAHNEAHDHNANDNDTHDNLPEFFSHFLHAPYYPVSNGLTITPQEELPVILITDELGIYYHEQLFILLHPPDNDSGLLCAVFHSLSLRAPPAC
jgi:hypothetical protein